MRAGPWSGKSLVGRSRARYLGQACRAGGVGARLSGAVFSRKMHPVMRAGLKLKRMDYAGACGFLAYSASAVVTPICLLRMADDLSFSLAGGGGIEAVRTLLILVVLIMSGFAAARWGKPIVLAVGSAILAVGMFAYATAPLYSVVLMAMVLVGLGSGILEGLINPLVQDAHPQDSGRYLNFVNAFWSIGVLASVLVVGELLTRGVSWRVLVAACGGLGAVSGALFLLFGRGGSRGRTTDPGERSSSSRLALGHMRAILKRRRFWVLAAALFSGGGAEAAFTFWSASYIQLHYGALARSGGIGTACFAGGMIAGRMLTGHYVHQKGLRNLILISAVAGVAISLFVFVVEGLVGFFVVLFFAGLSAACFWPSIQSYAADSLDVDTTMLFILLSCAGIPGFGFASWLMGIIGDVAGIRASFGVIPFFFLSLALIVAFQGRRRGEAVPSRPGRLADPRVPEGGHE